MPSLKPFNSPTGTDNTPIQMPFHISGQAVHQEMNRIIFEFNIEGDLAKIKWPDTFMSKQQRVDNLWEHTCLEVFFAVDLHPDTPYFEVNCSPNGDWNLYYLSGYRKSLKPYHNGRVSLLERENTDHGLRFTLAVEGLPDNPWRIGLSAVIEDTQGQLSYWALSHPGEQADFHDKRSFIL